MHSECLVRFAEPKDAQTIAELNIAMAWETESRQLDPATITEGVRAVFGNPDYGFYVVAESDGEVVGCLLITFEWSDWRCGLFWWIQSLYVRPRFRRRGVFRRLHEFVKAEALRRPHTCGIRLYVEQSNRVARRAYGEIGMKITPYKMYEEMFECRNPVPSTANGSRSPKSPT
jgi:GNAT superfamily N-acetyltransferase